MDGLAARSGVEAMIVTDGAEGIYSAGFPLAKDKA